MNVFATRCRALPAAAACLGLFLALSPPAGAHASHRPSSIERALAFLLLHQVARPLDVTAGGARVRDYPGNWPQYFHVRGDEAVRVRDVSPFMVAFIHHALAHVVEPNRAALGVGPLELGAARLMRRRAVAFMRGFEAAPAAPDAGTFAFWPYDADPATPDPLLAWLLTGWLKGPILGGARVPLNLPVYPPALAIPSDADVTATTYAALLDDAMFDGGAGSGRAFERFFTDWRDLGIVPRRGNPPWLPRGSGAYLTWLTYRERIWPLFPNDVDLVVNGNVLYALARYRRLDAAGAAEAAGLINYVTAAGLHRDRLEEITHYYPDNLAFEYVVSRAFLHGAIALAPAVNILAGDLERSVRWRADGAAYWDRGEPHLNTAFAVLTLLNAGRDSAIIDRAIAWLASEQGALGGFDESTFFVGRTDGGQVFEFTSASFTTAMALEAFSRHRLARTRWLRAGEAPAGAGE